MKPTGALDENKGDTEIEGEGGNYFSKQQRGLAVDFGVTGGSPAESCRGAWIPAIRLKGIPLCCA
jgi:hypothetical protein